MLASADRAALVRSYKAGAKVKDLAADYGIHRTTAAEIVQRAGVPKRPRGLDDEQIEQAIVFYAEGRSLAQIGREFEVDSTTVWRALVARGVAMRRP